MVERSFGTADKDPTYGEGVRLSCVLYPGGKGKRALSTACVMVEDQLRAPKLTNGGRRTQKAVRPNAYVPLAEYDQYTKNMLGFSVPTRGHETDVKQDVKVLLPRRGRLQEQQSKEVNDKGATAHGNSTLVAQLTGKARIRGLTTFHQSNTIIPTLKA